MIGQLLAKVIGTQNEREIKRLRPLVAEINALEPSIQPLTDEQLRGKTAEFKQRLAATLEFLKVHEVPYWTNAVREHREFLNSVGD